MQIQASVSVLNPSTQSTLSIQLDSPFPQLPEMGFMPIKISTNNLSPMAVRHSFRFTSPHPSPIGDYNNTLNFVSSLETAGRSRSSRTLCVPLAQSEVGFFVNLGCIVNGPQIRSSSFATVSSDYRIGRRYTLMSRQIHNSQWTPLSNEISSRGASTGMTIPADSGMLTGGLIEAADIPKDWRAFLGVSGLWMTAAEFNTVLSSQARRSVLLGVASGMTLRLFVENEVASISLPEHVTPAGYNTWRYGYGEISRHVWDGSSIPLSTALELWFQQPLRTGELFVKSDATARWELPQGVEPPKLNLALFVIIAILFAIIIGPINLFVLAPEGKRSRLFLTTPLISLGACLVLAVFVFVSEGTGGSGVRHLNVLLLPEHNSALIHQEQVARTGLLLAQDFTLPEDVWLTPVVFSAQVSSGKMRCKITDSVNYSGDWFTSRSLRGYILTSLRAQRERVELLPQQNPEEPPVIISSVSVPLTQLLYVDKTGRRWTGRNIRTGAPVKLDPVERLEDNTQSPQNSTPPPQRITSIFNTHLNTGSLSILAHDGNDPQQTESDTMDPKTNPPRAAPQKFPEPFANLEELLVKRPEYISAKLRNIPERPGWFYALSEKADNLALPTLRSISWTRTQALIFGPVVSN